MEIDSLKIVYFIITVIAGFFLRDLYNYIKEKLSKGDKPKIFIDFSCKWISTREMNPRKYKFLNNLIIKNIDTEPIYEVNAFNMDDDKNNQIIYKELLSHGEKIELKSEMIIPFGDSGNMISEAKKQLPKSFANPSILVTYQNKKGKKFKTNKLLHSILIID